jgi:hypothetical protein
MAAVHVAPPGRFVEHSGHRQHGSRHVVHGERRAAACVISYRRESPACQSRGLPDGGISSMVSVVPGRAGFVQGVEALLQFEVQALEMSERASTR